MSGFALPPLYPIIDAASFSGDNIPACMATYAEQLVAGGATLIQLRNKQGSGRDFLDQARAVRAASGDRARLVINDRADLCLAAEWDGVHLGQEDLSPEAARRILGNARLVGVSTHSPQQVREADVLPADYIAVGPVFATGSKDRPDPVIGLEGVRAARALTRKPLVAIGGITLDNARTVLDSGADSVAIISSLIASPRTSTEAFLRVLGYK